MPIDEASYRAWAGTAKATHGVVFAIAGTMIRRLMRWRMVRYVTWVAAFGPCLILSALIMLAHQGKGPLDFILLRSGMDIDDLLPALNVVFQRAIGFWAVLFTALIGGPLIAEDRRAHALPLYFSRPIGHLDYVAGKYLAFAFFLALLLVVPPICMYFVDAGLSDADGALLDRFPILLRSLVPGLVGIVTLGAIALGISSIARRTNYAALLIVGILVVAQIMGDLLAREIFHDPNWRVVSPGACVVRITTDLLPLPEVIVTRRRFPTGMNVGVAWLGLGLWTAAGLGLLAARIRKVEVVT